MRRGSRMNVKFADQLDNIQADIDAWGASEVWLTFAGDYPNAESRFEVFAIVDGQLDCQQYEQAECMVNLDDLTAIRL